VRWVEVTVLAREEAQEMVAHYMQELGAGGVSIEESWSPGKPRNGSFGEWFDPPVNDIPAGYALIRGYYPEHTDAAALTARLRELLAGLPAYGYDPGAFTVDAGYVQEEDWANAWKQYFKPLRVTERLTVKPVWEDYAPAPDEIVLELDPGMAFGTGTHPTTKLCLRALEETVTGGETVIDVGTGSGILAIGAAKLGAARVLALDLDPVAVASATANIALNGLQDRIDVRQSDLLGVLKAEGGGAGVGVTPPVDLVVANLLAEIILRFPQDVYEALRPGGVYIASGIYENREEGVLQGLRAAGFEPVGRLHEERWVALTFRKPEEARK
jgi:ribosomal protein L11 methyltransferase